MGLAFGVGVLGLCAAVISAAWGQWIHSACHLGVGILAIVYAVCLYYRQPMEQLEARCKQAEDMSCLHLRTIKALALAIEAKEQSTQGHLERLWAYSMETGQGDVAKRRGNGGAGERLHCCTTSGSWRFPSRSSTNRAV